ncbi:MAG: prolyl oligopeptidase family serine peptidase [Actinomycetota bacterium]
MPLWEKRLRAPYLQFPAWSRHAPDRLVFISNESGSDQAYAWDRAAETRRRASDESVGVIHATVTGDGAYAVWFHDEIGDESGAWVAAPFEGGEPRALLPGAPVGWPEGIALGRKLVAAVLSDRDGFAVYVSDRGGSAKEIHRDVDQLAIGGSDYGIEGFTRSGLSAEEDLLCLLVPQGGDNIHQGLRVLDPRTGEVVREIFDGAGLALFAAAWSPVSGDRRLLIGHEREDVHRPGIWDPATGQRTNIELDLPGEVIPVDWWPDGRSALLIHLHDGRDQALRYDVSSARLTEIPHPSGEIHGAGVRPDGEVWLRISSGEAESRLLDGRGEEVLAPEGERAPRGRPYRSFHFTNPRGDRLHGFVVTPDGEGPFPILMKVHGGPSWLYRDTWMPEVQAIVDHGIAVAMVNYRGSTGYGRTWRDFIIGNIGFPEVQDTVAGLDFTIAEGIADPVRAAIGGWSWGGYITLLALGLHPDRWACGVAGVPVGDYAASYDDSAPSLQAYDRSLLGGTVHEVPELVRERSPMTYADRVNAPTLVMIGEHDTRCPPEQAMHWVDAVRARDGDVELYTFGAGHVSFVIDEEVRQVAAKLDFLRRHLRP